MEKGRSRKEEREGMKRGGRLRYLTLRSRVRDFPISPNTALFTKALPSMWTERTYPVNTHAHLRQLFSTQV